MKTDLFQSCGHCWVFQLCWHFQCSTFTTSSSRIWNSSTGISSPPLALFIVMPPKAHLNSHSKESCQTLCDTMNHRTPGLPVHHQLPKFTQIHVHRVGDAIQPSHPLSSPSPPAPNASQDQGLFQWVSSWHEVAKVPPDSKFQALTYCIKPAFYCHPVLHCHLSSCCVLALHHDQWPWHLSFPHLIIWCHLVSCLWLRW